MRKLRAALLGAALGVTVLLVPAAAQADDGNGDSRCDYTEICLKDDAASQFLVNGEYMHTYYNSSWNHVNEWLYAPWWGASMPVMDNVKGVWNRDSSCRVQLWNFNEVWYVYADLPIGYRGDAGYDQNNAHQRCG